MDLKFALRSMRNNPGFTLLAVVVMALGIGANTAVFSVVNAVLLRPLAYRDPDRIVTVQNLWNRSRPSATVSGPDFHDWHDQSTAFAAMSPYYTNQTAVQIGAASDYGAVAVVGPEFFSVFQVAPALGRLFSAEEMTGDDNSPAVIASDAFWQQHFGGNRNAIGKEVRIYGKPRTIIGVLPPGFGFPSNTDLWLPLDMVEVANASRSAHNFRAVARLKPDVTLEQAQAQMTSIATRLEQLYPASNLNKNVIVDRMRDTLVGNIRPTLLVLLGAVAVVLLIACANMANLLLAKATSRTREMAIRAAMGASRARIVRQLIVESVLLAVVAGTAGLFLAIWGSDALVALAPANLPRLSETTTDGWVLAFTFGISIVSSILFGLAPALQGSRVDLNDALKQGGSRGVAGSAGGRTRNVLVVAEIALSVMLLAGAGLLIRSFQALTSVDNGFRPEKVLVARTTFPAASRDDRDRVFHFYDGLLGDIRRIPGVAAAGAAAAAPGHVRSNGGYYIDKLPPRSQMGVNSPQAVFSVIAPGTFQTLGIPLKDGRDFDAGDVYDAPFVAVINEALAKKSFAGQNPIGRVIYCGMDSPNPMKIVGVAGDVRQYGPALAPWPEIYMPYPQHPGFATALEIVVRTPAEPLALSETLRRKIREHSPDVPVRFTTMEASISDNVAAPRFRTLLLGLFALVAMCLAMAGVYGVMAYMVTQRSNEIGLRMALGASARDVVKMILWRGMALAAIGVALGIGGAIAATRLLTSMLFEVQATDPATYLAVAVLLAIVAVAASLVPAVRAARMDPLAALRQE